MEHAVDGEKKGIVFSGRLTYPNVSVLRGRLTEGLEEEDVEISFADVDEVDLSFLQLLCAALKTAEGASRKVSVAGPVPPGVRELVETAGMVSPLGRGDDGFWSRLAGKAGLHE